MKIKIVALLLIASLLLIVGCESPKNSPTPIFTPEGEIVGKDGTVFNVSLDLKGDVSSKYALDSFNFKLEGAEYPIPCELGQLYKNGWTILPNVQVIGLDDKVLPGRTIKFNGLPVCKNDATIEFYSINNNTYDDLIGEDIYKTEKCLLTSFMLDCSSPVSFELPGGICETSTALNVLNFFGDPHSPTEFESATVTETSLTYKNHNKSGISYTFNFANSGAIKSIFIEYKTEY